MIRSRSIPALLSLAFALLFASTTHAQVVGISGVFLSTNANEIDGYSATEIEDSNTAAYYDVSVVGGIFQDGNLITPPLQADGNPVAEAYPGTNNVRFGSRYAVASNHYLIAYAIYGSYSYYNPAQYQFANGFAPGGGVGDPSGTGYGPGGGDYYVTQQYNYLGTTAYEFTPAAPAIKAIDPKSDVPGSTGIMQVQGEHMQDDFGVMSAAFRDSGISVSVLDASPYSATLSYAVSPSAAIGVHQLVLSNTWGPSEPVNFSVSSPTQSIGPPPDACAVESGDSRLGYTSLARTGAPGGSGTMNVSFSGAAFNSASASVQYGPSSTPESIAASIAALISKQNFRYGLSAKAFGSYIIYSGSTDLGTVSNVATGPSYTTNADKRGAANACYARPSEKQYRVEYKAYIPVDNIPGPSNCALYPPGSYRGLDYLGDKSEFSPTQYRVRQYVVVRTSPTSIPVMQNQITPYHGKTVNFATQRYTGGGSPLAPITKSQYLESNPRDMTEPPPAYPWVGACNPGFENGVGYADLSNMRGSYAHSSRLNEVKVNFSGYANDPLEPNLPGTSAGAIQ